MNHKGAGHPARTGCVAAVVGSTTAGTSGRLTVTGTSLPMLTTTSVSASPSSKKAAGGLFIDPAFILSKRRRIVSFGKKKPVPGMLVGDNGVTANACRVTFLKE